MNELHNTTIAPGRMMIRCIMSDDLPLFPALACAGCQAISNAECSRAVTLLVCLRRHSPWKHWSAQVTKQQARQSAAAQSKRWGVQLRWMSGCWDMWMCRLR
eukprot:1158382-Pelagomonas_calceolata.AAC.3